MQESKEEEEAAIDSVRNAKCLNYSSHSLDMEERTGSSNSRRADMC